MELLRWGSVAYGATPSYFVSYCGQTLTTWPSDLLQSDVFFIWELFTANRRYHMSKLSLGGKTRQAQGHQQNGRRRKELLGINSSGISHGCSFFYVCLNDWFIVYINCPPTRVFQCRYCNLYSPVHQGNIVPTFGSLHETMIAYLISGQYLVAIYRATNRGSHKTEQQWHMLLYQVGSIYSIGSKIRDNMFTILHTESCLTRPDYT